MSSINISTANYTNPAGIRRQRPVTSPSNPIIIVDSDEEVEQWQNWLYEVTTLNCNIMTWLLRCVSLEERNLPTYDGLNEVDTFLDASKPWTGRCVLRP